MRRLRFTVLGTRRFTVVRSLTYFTGWAFTDLVEDLYCGASVTGFSAT
jgi:hypothetical protein